MSELHKLMRAGEWWAAHPDFPGYLVGSHGAVISVLAAPKILSPIRTGEYDGYQIRHKSGKTVKRYRHRLVAETFIGPAPDGQECRHLDGDKANADISNVRWGTHAENCEDQLVHNTRYMGDRHWAAKLSMQSIVQMKALRRSGATFKSIAQQFGVSTMTAHRAINDQSWRNS